MIDTTSPPVASDPVEYHADFLEFVALTSRERQMSFSSYVGDLRLAAAVETIVDSEEDFDGGQDDEMCEALAEAVFAELDDRRGSCDGTEKACYPFVVSDNVVTATEDGDGSLYVFLSLLSWYGKDAGPDGVKGEKIFEDVCAKASEAYLGGPNNHVGSRVFGFPRRIGPSGFAAALDDLCSHMREGDGHHKGRPKLPDQKDAKLDVVAWREFPDLRQGKLIAFGQCATGKHWAEKIGELPPPVDWCREWMADTPAVSPIRCFFVPHRIDRNNWRNTCVMGGILHDRCRIASLASGIDGTLKDDWMAWSSCVLSQARET